MADFSFDNIVSGSLLSDVTADVDADVTVGGLDDVNVDSKVSGKLDSDVGLDAKLTSTSSVTTTSSLDQQLEIAPITTRSTVDLAPVALDQCVRVELGAVPPTEVCTPYEQRFGLTVLGVELFAWVLSGETTTTLRPARKQPQLIGSVEQALDHRASEGGPPHGGPDRGGHRGWAHHDVDPAAARGLEIRLG
jgi:hypothetical protein